MINHPNHICAAGCEVAFYDLLWNTTPSRPPPKSLVQEKVPFDQALEQRTWALNEETAQHKKRLLFSRNAPTWGTPPMAASPPPLISHFGATPAIQEKEKTRGRLKDFSARVRDLQASQHRNKQVELAVRSESIKARTGNEKRRLQPHVY